MPFGATVVASAAVFWTFFFHVAHFPTTQACRLVHLALAAASVCNVSRSAARLAHSSVHEIWALTYMVVGRIASAASVPLASFAPWCSLPPFPLPFRAAPSFRLHAFPTPTSTFSPIPFQVAFQHVGDLVHQLPLLHRGAMLMVSVEFLAG